MGESDQVPDLFQEGNPRLSVWVIGMILFIFALVIVAKVSEHKEKTEKIKAPVEKISVELIKK